jgi:O-antigen/teichoic acid export membrane protein
MGSERTKKTAQMRLGSIRGLIASFGGQGLCLVIACGQIAVVSRLLPPEIFGVFGMTWAVLSLLYYVKDLGLSTAVVQSLREDQDFLDSAFILSVFGGIALAALTVVLGPIMAWFYGQPMVAEACYKLAPMFVIGGITSHYQAVMRRRMQYVRLNAITVIAQFVGTGGAIVLAIYGRGIDSLVFQTLGQEFTFLILLPLVCDWRPKSFRIKTSARELISFGGNLSIFRLVQNLSSTMDHVSLGMFTSPAIVGLYNRAQTLLSTPRRQLVLPLSQVMPTLLSRLQKHEVVFARASANILSATSLVWFVFLAYIIAIPDTILAIVLGEQWNGAAVIMQMLAVGEMFRVPLMVVNMAETQLGHAKSLRNFGLLSAPLTAGGLLLGAWIGGKANGALYMAIAYAILQVGLFVLRLFQIGNDTPFKPSIMWRAMCWPILICGVLTLVFRTAASFVTQYGMFAELGAATLAGLALFAVAYLASRKVRIVTLGIVRDIRGAMFGVR